MTLKRNWWWSSISEDLSSGEDLFIAITPKSIQTQNVTVPYMDQLGVFKNHLY